MPVDRLPRIDIADGSYDGFPERYLPDELRGTTLGIEEYTST